MEVVARHFESSQPTIARQVADELYIAESTVLKMFEELVDAGILHRVDRDEGSVALARPPAQITADELIEIGYRMCDESEAARNSTIIRRLREAQKNLASTVTLAKVASFKQPV